MRNRIRTIAGAIAVAGAVLGSCTAALASPATTTSSATTAINEITTLCALGSTPKAIYHGNHGCRLGQTKFRWNNVGPAGPTGPQGPSGIASTKTTDLGGIASVPTGGSFVSRSTQVGTIDLTAGTYLLNVNAKATPNVSSGIEVFPQFFVYDQASSPSFAGDLFNVGSGPLASNSTTIDGYFSGSGTITVTQATTLHLYAFGYDSDTSAGTYTLDDLTVTATQLSVG